jgi:hypothetical protein
MDRVEDIVIVTHIIKWKWAGRVARMDQRIWSQATSVWDIRLGKRALGDRRPNGQTPSREQQDRDHEQLKIGANGENTHNIRKSDISRNSSPSDKSTGALRGSTRRPFPLWD